MLRVADATKPRLLRKSICMQNTAEPIKSYILELLDKKASVIFSTKWGNSLPWSQKRSNNGRGSVPSEKGQEKALSSGLTVSGAYCTYSWHLIKSFLFANLNIGIVNYSSRTTVTVTGLWSLRNRTKLMEITEDSSVQCRSRARLPRTWNGSSGGSPSIKARTSGEEWWLRMITGFQSLVNSGHTMIDIIGY